MSQEENVMELDNIKNMSPLDQLKKQFVMLRDLSALMADNRISNGSYIHQGLKDIIKDAEEYLEVKK